MLIFAAVGLQIRQDGKKEEGVAKSGRTTQIERLRRKTAKNGKIKVKNKFELIL